MNVGSTKELSPEKRISITPETSKSFKNLGLKVILEKGFGESLGFSDKDYVDNGVEILSNSSEVLSNKNFIRFDPTNPAPPVTTMKFFI